jgi:predicted PurR-regulated permease PerM
MIPSPVRGAGPEAGARAFWLLLVALTGYLFYLLGPVLTPFLLALMIAYIFEKVVLKLAARGLSRSTAAGLVLLGIALATVAMVLILLPLLQQQLARITETMPRFFEWARTNVEPMIEQQLGLEVELDHLRAMVLEQLPSPQKIAGWVVPSLTSGGLALVGFFVNLVLVPVVLFYFLRDWADMVTEIDHMLPRTQHATIAMLAREIDAVLGEFLRGQLAVMFVMAAFYAIALSLVGVEYAVAIGLLTGMITFIPYVGAVFGITLGTVVAVMQFQALGPLLWVWGVFFAGQVVEGYVVVPKLVGDRIGLHPVVVIFALLAFGQLFGFFGVLLALPASAALLVWLRYLRGRYLASPLYQG